MRNLYRWLISALFVAVLAAPATAQAGGRALLLTLDGPLTAPMLTYLERGLTQAERDEAALIILRLNTPGGSLDLMESLVGAIRNSRTPVVVYVAPRGAMAGSAGTLITLAGHAAAMAPDTLIGAASPVGAQGENLDSTSEAKAKEATMALARALTERRGPEAVALAEATIESAEAFTYEEAHKAGLVDFIAADVADLLNQLDEFTVTVNGQPRTLLTRNLIVVETPMTMVETVLNLLTNPNVVFLLMSLGSLLIVIEVQTPGGWIAGVSGAVCLLLAFYGLGALPVNWFGIGFIILAVILFVYDFYAPSHGALTVAGAVALVVGALVLFNSPGSLPYFQVNVPLVIGTAAAIAGASLALLTYALRSLRRAPMHGPGTLIGQAGEMRSDGAAQVAGELWSVEAEGEPLQPGDKIEVLAVKGLRLSVRKKR